MFSRLAMESILLYCLNVKKEVAPPDVCRYNEQVVICGAEQDEKEYEGLDDMMKMVSLQTMTSLVSQTPSSSKQPA